MDMSHHIACPHCNAVNRVASARLADHPKCGKCRQALFNAHPITLTDANFADHIERGSLPVVVDFWAPWCGPCQSMAPQFERAAAELEPQFRLAKLNTDESPKTSLRHRIRSIPTLILFRGGKEIARQAGAMDARAIATWARSAAGASDR
jgi:thioredoxin 2